MAAGDAKPRRTDQRQVLESPLSATWRPAIRERAVLVGVGRGMVEEDLDELAALADSAGADPVARIVQSRAEPDPGTYVGKGKLGELHDVIHANRANAVILDQELSPGQLRSLEERLGVKVVDRTALILDIFALHARTREGKAQVELAQLNYLLPRLRGWGEAMSRLGGGIGTRGPGETKIEVDRQHIRRRISKLRRDIRDMATTRDVKRARRKNNQVTAGRDRRLHERRQVHPAQPAHGRPTRSSPTSCSPRSTRPRAGWSCPAAAGRRSPTPWGSSASCRTTSSRRSARRSRRWRWPPCPPRGGRLRARAGRADRRRAAGPRRDRRGGPPRGARPQQDRRGRGLRAGPAARRYPGSVAVSALTGEGLRGCWRSWPRRCRIRRSRSPCWCPSAGRTSPPGCTARPRSSARRPTVRGPSCGHWSGNGSSPPSGSSSGPRSRRG